MISWTDAGDGGRRSAPLGPTYSTVARFEDDENWPREAWSVALRLIRRFGDRHVLAEVSFLADDAQAPVRLLRRGSRFELLEGQRRVAKGIVVDSSVEVPDRITDFESALLG